MLTIRLPRRMEERLARLAKKTGRPKSYYVRQALQDYLDEQEDYRIAVSRLEEDLPTIPLDEVAKKLGLAR